MTDTPPEQPGRAADEFQGVIEPAAFAPVDEASLAGKTWLKPASAAFLSVFLVLLTVAWYVFTARSVSLQITPAAETLDIKGGLSFKVGDRYLIRTGDYELFAVAAGYYPLQKPLAVGDSQNQAFQFELEKLHGKVSFDSDPPGAKVVIDGELVGATPLVDLEVKPGEHKVEITADRYLPNQQSMVVEGRHVQQSLAVELTPAWSLVTLSSNPPRARILVDGDEQAATPSSIEVMQGQHRISLAMTGFKDWHQVLDILPNTPIQLPEVVLEAVDGMIRISSTPPNANVTVDDVFRGKTPIALEIEPGLEHNVQLFKSGFQAVKRSVLVESGQEQQLAVQLRPVLGEIRVVGKPADASVYVGGVFKGKINSGFSLPTQKQKIEVRREGYAPYEVLVTPRAGLEQRVSINLKTLEQAKWDSFKPLITTAAGQQLKLFRPTEFTMGASRREAGRRSNEVLKDIKLTRAFYLSLTEVTNEQFRRFEASHNSGNMKGNSLDGDKQPVVQVGWEQAALYCNWLSEQESLDEAYDIDAGSVVGFDPAATGYRLPTEAEWAWSARTTRNGNLKYPWGQALPPTGKSGNYADRSAAFVVGRVVSTYNDDYVVTAPVGSFSANTKGLYDLGGNVAEWVNDFYGTSVSLSGGSELDPMGPEEGKYHVIRGSSWAHGTVTELRLSYRDYGTEGRNDVGFRVARFAE